MNCPSSPEQQQRMVELAEHAQAHLGHTMEEIHQRFLKDPVADPCTYSRAEVIATLNTLLQSCLMHRRNHQEMLEVNYLNRHPDQFLELVNDINQLLTGMLKQADPRFDYRVQVTKMSKTTKF